MPTIYLTPSKETEFEKILNDLQEALEPVLGNGPHSFLVSELDKLQDLYDDLEREKDTLENDNEKLNGKVENLKQAVEDLNEEVESLQDELDLKE